MSTNDQAVAAADNEQAQGARAQAAKDTESQAGLRGFLSKQIAPLRAQVDAGMAKYHRVRTAWPSAPVKAMARLHTYLPPEPELILLAYSQGIFPMDVAGGKRKWLASDPRGVVVMSEVHIPSRVRRYARNGGFEVKYDTDFRGTIAGCADRPKTWISPELLDLYVKLHEMGAAHSVEAWRDGVLVGGGFGVAIGRVFSLDSLFSKVDQASKVAFACLAELLPKMGFELVDCQYLTRHFSRFGAREMRLAEYRQRMARGLVNPGRFAPAEHLSPAPASAAGKGKPGKVPGARPAGVAPSPRNPEPAGCGEPGAHGGESG